MESINDLCPTNVSPAKEQHLRRSLLTPDTGLWIFNDQQYISWQSKSASFLWLQGQSNGPMHDFTNLLSGRWQDSLNVLTSVSDRLTMPLGLP